MNEVILYTTGYCPYCIKAKELLDRKKVIYTEIRVDLKPELREEMIQKSGRRTVPQIFINGQAIGGCDDLYALEAQGTLNELLKK
ncbi:TPA: glutaredoxin 3 [Legionella pneumophila subsp. pneumophila]|uniref:Glutaredoxin n=1 Tax=Legionella pneumophila (strain Lens) TaxID=297245 RepID=Q5WUE2_LEGPL|nr:glutaredoxin 3 [Legionella pneumophila]AOW51245.1 glutaredoxin 3 [Legionella pneumophila subsp. pneumophila]AOW55151.1 glutaredoxin 3 [Legionella pneumophila subsp. pneumophila]AOW59266.1 glutaredoxin 3 [Legionella pneumophila subsp. pneumophila]AOW60544.1 glutaredoxin 3 [Legionella pneumophila subsp. pneumophila]AOW64753.1 glutaredoxin 3 [Legionella pneumophila subsp. pneumophila]